MKHTGNCFCGAVEVQVTGSPEGMGYCHCSSCRSWSGGPVNAFTLWNPEAVKVTRGAEQVGVYHKTERSYRKFCKACGRSIDGFGSRRCRSSMPQTWRRDGSNS